MAYLLKEVLKTLCGTNQWSYAVFWKIGLQNPKLLIWEECHYEPVKSSLPLRITGAESTEIPSGEWEKLWVSSENCHSQLGSQVGYKILALVSKMMNSNQVIILGEGLIGRAAFTGNYHWILSNSDATHSHPPEVLNELQNQFSAGVQTIAVIPCLPHGVVQLGSSLNIMENIGFVNDVKRLILQLGSVPGALLSDNCSLKDSSENFGVPGTPGQLGPMNPSGMHMMSNASVHMVDIFSQQVNSSLASSLVSRRSHSIAKEIKTNQEMSGSGINPISKSSHGNHLQTAVSSWMKPNSSLGGQFKDRVVGAEVIPSNFNARLNQPYEFNWSCPSQSSQMSSIDCRSVSNNFCASQQRENGSISSEHNLSICHRKSYSRSTSVPCSVYSPLSELQKPETVKTELVSYVADHSKGFDGGQCSKDRSGLNEQRLDNKLFEGFNNPLLDTNCIPDFVRDFQGLDQKIPCSGDDLFDIFGMDFRNKLLRGDGLDGNTRNTDEDTPAEFASMKDLESTFYSLSEGISESGVFSGLGSDHLLDAVVSKASFGTKQSSGENMSCKTAMMKNTDSSVPIGSSVCGVASMSKPLRGEKFQLPGSLNKAEMLKSSSFKSGCSREDTGNCSQTTTLYGSQISSWMEHGNSMKQENSVSTGYSKRSDEVGKMNRKRLKPGENPRPRPKDRQMIQDRVKELREIVPNGAKCSIDALLERTIKHMLFLQSVTKHADKLKNSGESKILNKEVGLLLKDNFEGGATWAFEVGSQSMVCPIIVEDLNNPRQMLVEMLCEERGFFLEIADLIRGMGLTILKGVMEARNDKIWARFVIEANRDITRMEIFMSLVNLLEQTLKGSGGPSSFNPVDPNNTLMVQDSFTQATPIITPGTLQ